MRQQLWSIQNSFPVQPKKTYDQNLPIAINRFIEPHHFEGWIRLEDKIHFDEKEQYLKRFYQKQEYPNKIKMLGDYYRFHFYAPRIFIPDVARIVQQNVEDKREIEYMIVTKQMQKNKQNQIYDERKLVKKAQRYEKLIKDVQLSYQDFEQKEPRKLPQKKQNYSKNNLHQNKQKAPQTLSRVDSLKFKGSYLVFKPRKSQTTVKETKERPKTNRKEEKQERNGKNTLPIKNGAVNKKTSSKTTSACNSIASQGLNRSKSRPQLSIMSGNKLQEKKIVVKQQNMTTRNNSRSNLPSAPNSLTKNSNKKEKTGEKQSKIKILSRNGSRTDIKQMNHQQFNSQKQTGDKAVVQNKGCLSRKNSQCELETKKKRMFTRALDIKKKR